MKLRKKKGKDVECALSLSPSLSLLSLLSLSPSLSLPLSLSLFFFYLDSFAKQTQIWQRNTNFVEIIANVKYPTELANHSAIMTANQKLLFQDLTNQSKGTLKDQVFKGMCRCASSNIANL